jgi:hypothetical protein
MNIENVILVGGTHGNEPVGIQLINRWEKNLKPVFRESFNISLMIANKGILTRILTAVFAQRIWQIPLYRHLKTKEQRRSTLV